jgi:hypothetical protein
MWAVQRREGQLSGVDQFPQVGDVVGTAGVDPVEYDPPPRPFAGFRCPSFRPV